MDHQLEQLLPALSARPALCKSLLPGLLDCVANIAHALRKSHHVALAGTANAFGDDQLNVDVVAEDILRAALSRCPAVATVSSEEDPTERVVNSASAFADKSERYAVAFDPLDGSSIIGPNWTVGTIVGIWDGTSALRQSPADKMIAAVLGIYGPRTTAILAIRLPGSEPVCLEIAIGVRSESGQCCSTILRPAVAFAKAPFKTRYFAPANLRAAAECPSYMRLIAHFVENKYTLRYSGGLVPDLVHALVKGHGVYVSPVTATSTAKLRRLYELCPVALAMECAGGRAIDPDTGDDILARPLDSCDERAGLVCGTPDEVSLVRDFFLGAFGVSE
ncbi:Sedoheptulose-bisphosphatase [Purpureocillium takamizusanense]|uniref:Sedoheptulose-bisphosphatase n=1 Tax=Purpureocillium takamizusanense TaxID=2060973 RepID=A0A9Q8QCD6_9HYPO|nr:Sedoheptulose-bisphosphatase [Purpureocillium takamizusanense]UNI16237.1 Sedoheptulose-bisphosphatase [Purpureocillium takamizusanense]